MQYLITSSRQAPLVAFSCAAYASNRVAHAGVSFARFAFMQLNTAPPP